MRALAIVLLCYLGEEMQTVRGLALHLDVSKPSITQSLNRLEGLNLIERKPDPADGRSVLVGRTKAGRQLLVEIQSLVAETARSGRPAVRPDPG
jgi:DNA-binding MarR family transcriptional regulator